MSVVVPLSEDVAGPLAVLAAVSVMAVLAAGSVAVVLAAGSVAALLAAGSVAAVLAAGSVAAVLAAESVAAEHVSAPAEGESRMSPAVSDGCPPGKRLGTVAAAVDVPEAVQVAVLVQVAVFSAVQVGVDVDRRARLLGQMMRWRHPPVYRPLVDLSTMEERHIIVTYRLDRATIQELCAQLEPDLMSAIRHPTGIPPLVQVL
ncbi:hypothetical protein NDU88_005203 [Pleurodeles waltl]|uniref:Uncharacterized protein n=1 Tax=Pleurodeles waltl TaxID=8319 RepID=A0AAV7LBV6_PLEWA|nr:hypothetical protein NDU88_005203 [Pleurodeles waltl]